MWLIACALVAPSLQQERYDTPLDPARTWDLPRDSLDDRLLDVCQTRNKTTAADAQAAIDAGGNPSAVGDYNYTALMWAIVRHKNDLVHTLLENGADPEPVNAWGRNAIFIAAWEGDDAVMADLIAHGVNVSGCAAHDAWTAAHKAAEMGHAEQLRQLIAAGANVSALTGDAARLSPLDLAKTRKTQRMLRDALASESPELSDAERAAARARAIAPDDSEDEVVEAAGAARMVELEAELRMQKKAKRAAKAAKARQKQADADVEEEAKRMLMQKEEL